MRRAAWLLVAVGVLLIGTGATAATLDALAYRSAIRQADGRCADPALRVRLARKIAETPVRNGYQGVHLGLAVQLTEPSSTLGNALHRAYRAKLGPVLVSREETAGAVCALAPWPDRLM